MRDMTRMKVIQFGHHLPYMLASVGYLLMTQTILITSYLQGHTVPIHALDFMTMMGEYTCTHRYGSAGL